MAVPRVSVASRGDTARESVYRLGSGRKDHSFHEAVGALIHAGATYEEAPGIVEASWASAGAAEGDIKMSSLCEADRILFSSFRWWAERGRHAYFVKTSLEAETYVLTDDPLVESTCVDLGGRSLYDMMHEAYLGYLAKGEIPAKRQEDGSLVAQTLAEYWQTRVMPLWQHDATFRLPHLPKEISDDAGEPSFLHILHQELREGETPAWDGWLEQMPPVCRPIFRAWVWSIFDPRNRGRQCVWLRDGGYSGKSSVGRALNLYMGGVGVGTISKGSTSSQFAYSTVFGKRLLVYGDNKNPRLLSTEVVHSILGGDAVQVERKGQDSFSAILHAKLVVFSNVLPEIDLFARNEVSRVLYIPLSEPPEHVLKRYCEVGFDGKVMRREDGTPIFVGGNLTADLLGEMPCFLTRCRADYATYCPSGQDIAIPQEMWSMMDRDCCSPEQMAMEEFFSGHCEFEEGALASLSDLKRLWDMDKVGDDMRWAAFRRYLLDAKGARMVRENGRAILNIKITHE